MLSGCNLNFAHINEISMFAQCYETDLCSEVFSFRPWPKPVLLKQPEENKLGFEVWDPRVSSLFGSFFI